MKIEGNTIIFKSTPESYNKEEKGLKPYTIRRIILWSEMRDFETFYYPWLYNQAIRTIRIINTDTRDDFTRRITDISQFEGLWIFSWTPGGD